MTADDRAWKVRDRLFDYVKSPSLRHIRDPHALNKLAHEIVLVLDHANSIWQKWDGQREVMLKSSAYCWIPIDDLRDFLNRMPGPQLTTTDVTQRLKKNFEAENYPNEEVQPSCLALYMKEKEAGTELPAIVGLLQDHLEDEEGRIRNEREAFYKQAREQDKMAREQRLLSGDAINAGKPQASLHAFANAGNITKRTGKERLRHRVRMPDGHTIGLVYLASDFCQHPVGCKAYGASDVFAHILAQALFDAVSQGGGVGNVGFVEFAGKLINRLDGIDGNFARNLI